MKRQSNSPLAIELLEERAHIEKERVVTGKITLSKQVRQRTVNLPITLTEEYLIISHKPNEELQPLSTSTDATDVIDVIDKTAAATPYININGEMTSLEHPVEILLSSQRATLTKTTHVVQDISLNTQTKNKEHVITTTLQKEILDIDGDDNLIIKE